MSSVADRETNLPVCCGEKTYQIITSSPMIGAMAFTGWKGFYMPDGKGEKGTWIDNGGDFKKYLKENDKMPASEGIPEAQLQKKNIEEAHAKKRRKDVEKVVMDRVS
jgi:hypothetical protein